MASSKVLSGLCSRLQPISFKFNNKKASFFLSADISIIKSSSQSQARRFSRLPMELSSLETMMPLHSAIASARLQSSLSIESQSWCLVPQEAGMLPGWNAIGFFPNILLTDNLLANIQEGGCNPIKHLNAFMTASSWQNATHILSVE